MPRLWATSHFTEELIWFLPNTHHWKIINEQTSINYISRENCSSSKAYVLMVYMQSSIHDRGHMWSPEDIFVMGFYFFHSNIGFRDWTKDTRLSQEVPNPLSPPIGPQKALFSTLKPARIKKHHRKGSWNIIRTSWKRWSVEWYLVEKTHFQDSWIHTNFE